MGLCGGSANAICGTVEYAELTPVPGLPASGASGVVVELRDPNGKVIQSKTTAAGGAYTFTGPVATLPYYVTPAVGRNQVASTPNAVFLKKMIAPQTGVRHTVRGTPVKLQVTGTPGTFVLISTVAYVSNSANPPSLGGKNKQTFYSGIIGTDGKLDLSVAAGNAYITCWTNTTSGQTTSHMSTSVPFTTAPLLTPNVTPAPRSCPP